MLTLDHKQLLKFILTASLNTYATGRRYESKSEREGFKELTYQEGDFHYRDSYVGYHRSWGTELVRYQHIPVWVASYGGGMEKGKEDLARECFKFLRTSLRSDEVDATPTFRGPRYMRLGDWRYYYEQDGDYANFTGQERITYQQQTIFNHAILGGLIINKEKI